MAVDRIALSRQGALEECPQEGIKGGHSTGCRWVQGMDCIERQGSHWFRLGDAVRRLYVTGADTELSTGTLRGSRNCKYN